MPSLQILNLYATLLEYPEENDIKEDSQKHLGRSKPGCFLLPATEGQREVSRSVLIEEPESTIVQGLLL
jgi:hypothetical protein